MRGLCERELLTIQETQWDLNALSWLGSDRLVTSGPNGVKVWQLDAERKSASLCWRRDGEFCASILI